MLSLGIRNWKLVVRGKNSLLFVSQPPTTIPQLLCDKCVQAVLSLGITSGFTNKLHSSKTLTSIALCSTNPLITNSYSTFTSGFTLFNSFVFNLFSASFIPTIHTTNKNNDILYKLITIN